MESNINLPSIKQLLSSAGADGPLNTMPEWSNRRSRFERNYMPQQMMQSLSYSPSPINASPTYSSALVDPSCEVSIPPLLLPEKFASNPTTPPFIKSLSSPSSANFNIPAIRSRTNSVPSQPYLQNDYVSTPQENKLDGYRTSLPSIRRSSDTGSILNINKEILLQSQYNNPIPITLGDSFVKSPKASTGGKIDKAIEKPAVVLPKRCRCRNYTKSGQHIPRPRNAFILFRQYMHGETFGKHKKFLVSHGSFETNSLISREIGQKWRSLPDKEKEYWHELARKEKEQHKLKYTDYKYIPRRSETFKNSSLKGNLPSVEFSNYRNKINTKRSLVKNKGQKGKKEDTREICEYCVLQKKGIISSPSTLSKRAKPKKISA